MNELIGIPAITVISYVLIEIIKIFLDKKYLPIMAGIIGGILGVLMYVLKLEIMPSKDIISSLAIGIISGLASTGTDQIKKQLNKNKGENKNGE